CELVDCLQYSDKVKLLLEEPEAMVEFGFSTRGLAKRRAKEMESLRNNLAHAQDIVAYDWPQIVRLAERVAEMGRGRDC
ncbi:MAG: hypothetical protein PVI87_02860, partial [Gammaproteobacteria bacterium]